MTDNTIQLTRSPNIFKNKQAWCFEWKMSLIGSGIWTHNYGMLKWWIFPMKEHLRGMVLERLWYHPTFSSFSDPFLSIKLLSLSFLLRPHVAIPPQHWTVPLKMQVKIMSLFLKLLLVMVCHHSQNSVNQHKKQE